MQQCAKSLVRYVEYLKNSSATLPTGLDRGSPIVGRVGGLAEFPEVGSMDSGGGGQWRVTRRHVITHDHPLADKIGFFFKL